MNVSPDLRANWNIANDETSMHHSQMTSFRQAILSVDGASAYAGNSGIAALRRPWPLDEESLGTMACVSRSPAIELSAKWC
jgi:hypothetical protein